MAAFPPYHIAADHAYRKCKHPVQPDLGLKMFDLIYVMTGGGPGNATESFGTLMMNEMSAGRYAQSVAVNLVFTVLLVIVSVVYQKFSSRWETVL